MKKGDLMTEVLIANKRGKPVGQIEVITTQVDGSEVTHNTARRDTTPKNVNANKKGAVIADKNGNVVGHIDITHVKIDGSNVTYGTQTTVEDTK